MKRKISKIFGVALTVTLLLSLILAVAPVSGKTLEWGKAVILKEGTFGTPYQVMESSDILDMVAAATDGKLWAVMNDEVTPSAQVYRSTDSGVNWSLRSPAGTDLTRVAVAPDDSSVVVAMGGTAAGVDKVYLSTENGEAGTWSTVGDTTTTTGNLTAIFTQAGTISSVDISAKDGDGYRWMVVGGQTNAGGNDGVIAVGKMAALGGWTDYTAVTNWVPSTDVVSVAFSPKFRYDEALLAVSVTTNSILQRCDVGTPVWDTTLATIATGVVATGADISLPDTYYGVDDTERVAYISLITAATGGVYRMDDTTANGMLTGQYSAVAYNSDSNSLLAGYGTSGAVRVSTNPDATSPSFSIAPSLKRANGAAVSSVVWAGSTPLCSTTGTESGVFKGTDDGKSWNGISLLDSDLANITDVAISEDGAVIYLAAVDTNQCNIYRKQDGSWARILSEDMGAANSVLVRMAPDKPEVVFVAWAGTKDIRYSVDSGESWKRSESDITIKDIEAKSDQIVFTMDASGQVSTSLDGGGFFGDFIKSLVGGDDMVVEPVSGDLIVIGGSVGFVRASVSTDNGATFTRTPEALGIADDATATFVAADEGYADNGIIYAAQSSSIVRWEVGGAMEDWKDVTTSSTFPVAAADAITGLACYGGALYAMYTGDLDGDTDVDDSAFARTIEGTARTPTWIASGYVEDSEFNLAPQSMRFSGSSGITVWAVNTTPTTVDDLYSYTDIVEATVAPVLSAPANGYSGSVDTVLKTINPVRFSWAEVDELAYYQLRLGTNEAVSVNYLDYSVAAGREWVSIGAGTTVASEYPFVAGETYYWKVRVNSPVYGPWSEVRSFSIEVPEAAVTAPQVTVQAPAAAAPQITVQAPAPAPAPQVTVQVPPAEVPPTPGYIWAIIAIGAILVIAVIVLIVRTRRPV